MRNRTKIKHRINPKFNRENTYEKLMNQSAGEFYLAVDEENPKSLNLKSNKNKVIYCQKCNSQLIQGLSYCEECGFKIQI